MRTNRAVPPQGKVAYYRSDGTGRDTYIREHNGGLLSKDRLHSLNQIKPQKQRNFTFAKSIYNRNPDSYQNGGSNKFPHYVSDGSGRDFYIGLTEGGNSTPFRWRNQTDYNFKNSLRNHHPYPSINPEQKDIFAQSQMRATMRERSFRNTIAPYQRTLDKRLSQPKQHLVPAPVHTYYGQKFTSSRISKCTYSSSQN